MSKQLFWDSPGMEWTWRIKNDIRTKLRLCIFTVLKRKILHELRLSHKKTNQNTKLNEYMENNITKHMLAF